MVVKEKKEMMQSYSLPKFTIKKIEMKTKKKKK